MAGHLFGRFASAAAIAVLVLGAMALPVAAASQTLVVDDNAVQCPSATYTSIQDAIDDADPGDTVRVCPGRYPEQLTINKAIVVKATPLFAAHIDVPGILAPVDGVVAAVRIGGNDATFQGFKMHIVAGGVIPNVRPSALGCAHVDAGIYVRGLNDVVRYNRINVTGSATLSGACGYDYGIVVGQHTLGAAVRPSGEALGSATARVTFNKIRDFKFGGILVEDEDSYAFVRRNAIKYLHLEDPGCLILSGIPCGPVSATNTGLNGVFVGAFGIGVESGAEADVIRNAIRSGPNSGGGTRPVIVTTPQLSTGIWLQNLDSGESNTVFHNAVWRVRDGIFTLGGATGAVISYNHVTGSTTALVAADTGDEWHHNHVEDNTIGIRATVGGNKFHDNNSHDNFIWDCLDSTGGGIGTGTAGTDNTWMNNIGALSSPDAICDPASGT